MSDAMANDMTLGELMDLMRAKGAIHVKLGHIEVTLASSALMSPGYTSRMGDTLPPPPPNETPEERSRREKIEHDALLYASAEG